MVFAWDKKGKRMCRLIALLLVCWRVLRLRGAAKRSHVASRRSCRGRATAEGAAGADAGDLLRVALGGTGYRSRCWRWSAIRFEHGDWTQQVSSDAAERPPTWRSSQYGAVAYLECLHYDCGVTQEQIDSYYSPAGFDVIFSNYTSYEKTAQCTRDGLRLFEFDAVSNDSDYHVLYWVEQVTPTRVAGLMLAFPATEPAQQAEYAGQLFPDLPTCEAAAG